MLKSVLPISRASKVVIAKIPFSSTPCTLALLQRAPLMTPFSLSITGSSQDMASVPSRLKKGPVSTLIARRTDGSNVRSKAKLLRASAKRPEISTVNWSPGLTVLFSRKMLPPL